MSRGSCGHAKRYKGIRKPRCLGGKGCVDCWAKYNYERALDLVAGP